MQSVVPEALHEVERGSGLRVTNGLDVSDYAFFSILRKINFLFAKQPPTAFRFSEGNSGSLWSTWELKLFCTNSRFGFRSSSVNCCFVHLAFKSAKQIFTTSPQSDLHSTFRVSLLHPVFNRGTVFTSYFEVQQPSLKLYQSVASLTHTSALRFCQTKPTDLLITFPHQQTCLKFASDKVAGQCLANLINNQGD